MLLSLAEKVWRTTHFCKTSHYHNTGDHCHHHCRQRSNKAVNCLWVKHSMQSFTRCMSAHWVQKCLGPGQKWTQHKKSCCHFCVCVCVDCSRLIPLAICDPRWDLGSSFSTRDEEQSKLWKHQGSLPPKWNVQTRWRPSVPSIKGHTNTRAYYADLLRQIKGRFTRGMLFHQDNALAHTSTITMATIQKYWFEVVEHPLYSFVFCLVCLEFNSPVYTVMVMLSRSIYLTTLFLGKLNPF